jgi:hypothetical protein
MTTPVPPGTAPEHIVETPCLVRDWPKPFTNDRDDRYLVETGS